MVRGAVLLSGDGLHLQPILDSVYFKEIPNFELVAVLATNKNSAALARSSSAGVDAFVVDPELFPNITSHSMAIANKLRDMDIDLVILAGYSYDLGVIPYQYKNRIIGTYPSLIPAFDDAENGNIFRRAIERGIKVTGATAYFADNDGCVGNIIMQVPIEVRNDDTPESLARRIREEGEWKLLPKAISLFCENKLSIHGTRVIISQS